VNSNKFYSYREGKSRYHGKNDTLSVVLALLAIASVFFILGSL